MSTDTALAPRRDGSYADDDHAYVPYDLYGMYETHYLDGSAVTGPLPTWVDDITGPLPVVPSGEIALPDLDEWDDLDHRNDLERHERPVGLAPSDDADDLADDSARTGALTKGGVAVALLVLAAGGSTAVAMDKELTVSVDGVDRVVHTFSGDVAGALDSADVDLGPADQLAPGPNAEVHDGDRVVVNRARQVSLVVNGKQMTVTTTARTVEDALRQMGLPADRMVASAPMAAAIPAEGMRLDVRSPKTVTLVDGGGAPRQVSTTAMSTSEFLSQQRLAMGPADTVTPSTGDRIVGGSTIVVTRNAVTQVSETRPVAPPMRTVDDPTLEQGETEVTQAGAPGEEVVNWSVRTTNGRETGRVQAGPARMTKAPVGGTIARGTKPEPKPAVANVAKWNEIAECESSGDWSANTGNGYYGGIQFDKQTWNSYGGDALAARPDLASKAEQISIAEKVREDRGGYSAWPTCGS